MIKYTVYTDSFEIRLRTKEATLSAGDVFTAYMEQGDHSPRPVAVFDTEEQAVAAMKKALVRTDCDSSFYGGYLLTGVLAYVEQAEYDEDGEFIQGGDICEYAAKGYSFSYEND